MVGSTLLLLDERLNNKKWLSHLVLLILYNHICFQTISQLVLSRMDFFFLRYRAHSSAGVIGTLFLKIWVQTRSQPIMLDVWIISSPLNSRTIFVDFSPCLTALWIQMKLSPSLVTLVLTLRPSGDFPFKPLFSLNVNSILFIIIVVMKVHVSKSSM